MIAPISGLTTYAPIASIQPMNYAVTNDAELSESYRTEATRETSGVNAVKPVQYPNAQVVDETRFNRTVKAKEATKVYNDIANSLNKASTGYTNKRKPTSYESIGNTIDVYA